MSDRGERARWERWIGVAPGPMARPGDAAAARRGDWGPALLRLAYDRVAPGAAVGADGRRAVEVLPGELDALAEAVVRGWYRPGPLREATLGPGGRRIGVAGVVDQVVMGAWRRVAEPSLERRLAGHVWGCRPGRDRRGAVRALTRAVGVGALIRCDIRRMFESLDHRELRAAVARQWGGGGELGWVERVAAWLGWGHAGMARNPVAGLVDAWLRAWTRGRGVPTGVSVSPALANVYLADRVDGVIEAMIADGRVLGAMRYVDDFALVVPGDGAPVLRELDRAVRGVRLRLHPGKTRVHQVDVASDWPAKVLGIELAPRDGRLEVVGGLDRRGGGGVGSGRARLR